MVKSIYLAAVVCIGLLFFHTLFSCNDDKQDNKQPQGMVAEAISGGSVSHMKANLVDTAILKDYNTWYTYSYRNINLSQDFIGLDKNSSVIKKATFLNLLLTGKYVPIKVDRKGQFPCYKLYTLKTSNEDIRSGIKQMAEGELVNYTMEGKELPAFNYKDLQGNRYTKENTKGKIVVVKCWFIHCVACVKEFPELNKLVDQHKGRKDLLFISLAMDTKEDLTAFLRTKVFNYAVVSVDEDYVVDELNVRSFPTHMIIGRNGKIVRVTSNYKDLEYALKKEVAKG